MATTFKTLNSANDVASTRTLLHEAIPLTGTIASGTYADANIKTYSHGMFESVYDYPYLSSSANHIFDITTGYASNSSLSSSASIQNSKKLNIYSQMAQVLVGYDATGSIQSFDRDGDIASGGDKINEAIFVNFSRLLTKDEIKKGSFSMTMMTGGITPLLHSPLVIADHGAANSYKVNSPAGEYGILYTGSLAEAGSGVGLVYYQAGVAIITGSIFPKADLMGAYQPIGTYDDIATGSNIQVMADSYRNRLNNISFNNTVELNSTVYFCRASHNEFNYSNNPTYLSQSQIRVKNSTTDNPVSYVTTVGLYSSDNELLAVAKLSEPLKKDPTTEVTLRVRLDF
jgi:hypothetical protein